MSKIVDQFLKEMKPKPRRGRPANVTACPYCGRHLSQSNHAKHRAGCKAKFQKAPPQAAELAQDPGGRIQRGRHISSNLKWKVYRRCALAHRLKLARE